MSALRPISLSALFCGAALASGCVSEAAVDPVDSVDTVTSAIEPKTPGDPKPAPVPGPTPEECKRACETACKSKGTTCASATVVNGKCVGHCNDIIIIGSP